MSLDAGCQESLRLGPKGCHAGTVNYSGGLNQRAATSACVMTGSIALLDQFQGCLLGGAVGDALGAPVEFMSLSAIRAQFGPRGVRDFVPAYGRVGAITD